MNCATRADDSDTFDQPDATLGVLGDPQQGRAGGILLHLAKPPNGRRTMCGRYDTMTCDLMPDDYNCRGHRTCVTCDTTAGQASWDDR